MAVREPRNKTLYVKLSDTAYNKLEELVQRTHVSASDVMRLLLRNGEIEDVLKVPS